MSLACEHETCLRQLALGYLLRPRSVAWERRVKREVFGMVYTRLISSPKWARHGVDAEASKKQCLRSIRT
jgi:hypothetical protein